jgi:hypothetical protein
MTDQKPAVVYDAHCDNDPAKADLDAIAQPRGAWA